LKLPALRLPLYLKFLGWAGLNLLLIAASLYMYAPRDESGLNLFLTQSVRERLISIAAEIADELYGVDAAKWGPILTRHKTIPDVEFTARATLGPRPFGGASGPPPLADIDSQGSRGPQNRPPFDRGPPGARDFNQESFASGSGNAPAPGMRVGRGGPLGPGPAAVISIARLQAGPGYEVDILIETIGHGGPPRGYAITAHAATTISLLRLLGINRELRFGLLLLLLSALLWWPFIWRITRTVRQLSEATRRVARGRLDTRVSVVRRDELGDLATAVNSMTERLEALVSGQRQFVADVAHEVISPVARMQIGLGILEGRVDESAAARLKDILEDLDGMAVMLNELLLFSRSGLDAARSMPAAIELRPLVEKIVATESNGLPVKINVSPTLHVNAHSALLSRAVANLIRNAVRYGAQSTEPVEVSAFVSGDRVKIIVADRGPGVPDSALARLGEPFFRPELARSRATGGFGLGLAIVKRCIVACDGEVSFNNRPGRGFEAVISVPT
jgi:two-component system sensor histidine kinase CpxA